MNNKPSRELLSAYFDGEVLPSEDAEVHRRLEASAEAERELADYRQISELIQDLPIESAPPEFRSAVMQAAERQMLLPAGDLPGRVSGSRSHRSRRRWILSGGALATVAMLFLAVRLFDGTGRIQHTGGSAKVALENSHAESAMPAESVSESEFDRLAKSPRDARRAVASDHAMSKRKGSSRAEKKSVRVTRSAAAAVAMNATKDGHGSVARVDVRAKARRTPGGAGLVFGSNLKNARVGEAVKALEHSGNRVTVITLTVVDRRAGLDDLQILLARHQIPKVAGTLREEHSARNRPQKSKGNLKKQTAKSLAEKSAAGHTPLTVAHTGIASGTTGELVAVYVEATPKQLAGVLGELQRRKRFVGLNVGRPIAVAQLDAVSRWRVADRKRERRPLSGPAKDASGRRSGSAAAAKSSAGEKESQKTKTAPRKRHPDAVVARSSRQLQLALPADTFKAGYAKRRSADRPGEDRDDNGGAAARKPNAPLLADKKATARSNRKLTTPVGPGHASQQTISRSRSVQVLFVLVTERKNPAQPPPRPATKKSSPPRPPSRQRRGGMPG